MSKVIMMNDIKKVMSKHQAMISLTDEIHDQIEKVEKNR